MTNLPQMQQMLKKIQEFQEQFQRQMDELVVEAAAGGGMVTVRMNGQKQLVGVVIEREVFETHDLEMLQDLVVAAVNEASRKVDEQVANRMGNLTGGLHIPGLNLP